MALVLLFAFSAAGAGEQTARFGEFIPADPPQPAPQVGFTDLAGNPARLADFKGKPAVVNLWATWCGPCRREMPSLDRLAARFGGRLLVAAVSEDSGGGKVVKPFMATRSLPHLGIYLDPDEHLAHAFQVSGLPTSIVLDAEGRVVGTVEGAADWNSPRMIAVLRPLVKPAAAPVIRTQDDRDRHAIRTSAR